MYPKDKSSINEKTVLSTVKEITKALLLFVKTAIIAFLIIQIIVLLVVVVAEKTAGTIDALTRISFVAVLFATVILIILIIPIVHRIKLQVEAIQALNDTISFAVFLLTLISTASPVFSFWLKLLLQVIQTQT